MPEPTSPPIAEKRDHTYSHHGITISDPYHWLKDQSYPTVDDKDVLDHLKAEHARKFEILPERPHRTRGPPKGGGGGGRRVPRGSCA